ncbi:stage II sporulation protein M [Vulcanisaeta distributa]|uniref:Stage II sporulation protein M n=1 Tax=Vulcanisaeta distributa (strain DSM 14429 / JCM 11212 / NBRC 100878 / IC-017) TaxID=572478 RepID=E1QQ85_VULDI|nr:stage II sporulation protein M [Vulcanisaeta distributa]ADN51572.1 protein of unknown function DUF95 transmembrane [Vulcanisaeta distributa DSM 14429]
MIINIKRVALTYVVELILLVLLSIIGFYVGPSFVNQSVINSLRNQLISTADLGPNYIFLHNLEIDSLMAIPVVGPLFFVLALVMTGFVLGVYVAYALNSIIGLVISLFITMFFPHGIIELLAYAFSTTGSITFTRDLINSLRGGRRIGKGDVTALIIYYLISVILLYIAANVEYFEITALRGLISSMIS